MTAAIDHPQALTEEKLARAAAMLEDECPVSEIARTLGCGKTTIDRYFPNRPRRNGRVLGKYHRELAEKLGLPAV
jgi:DNA invertase Pin-like site-specific DNA recombinase